MNDDYDNSMTDLDMLQKLTRPDTATEKQLKYYHNLINQRDITDIVKTMPTKWLELMNDLTHDLHDHGPFTVWQTKKYAKTDLSKFITQLVKQPELPKQPVCGPAGDPHTDTFLPGESLGDYFGMERIQAETFRQERYNQFTEVKQPLEDGMYRHPNGTIYKVYHTVHGNNTQVAKRLKVIESYGHGPATVKFVYEGKKPLRNLKPSDRLSMDEARELGALYGTCVICARTLTNELSIALGIGPICGRREFGGEFEFLIDEAKLKLNPAEALGAKMLEDINSGKKHLSQINDEEYIRQECARLGIEVTPKEAN